MRCGDTLLRISSLVRKWLFLHFKPTNQATWKIKLNRNINNRENRAFGVDGAFIQVLVETSKDDCPVWRHTDDGKFSMKSMYHNFGSQDTIVQTFPRKQIWKNKASLLIAFFSFREVAWSRILTMNNFRRWERSCICSSMKP